VNGSVIASHQRPVDRLVEEREWRDAVAVDRQRYVGAGRPGPRARPRPIRRAGCQATPHWVVVGVGNLGVDLADIHQVPVIAAATLPESMRDGAAGLWVLKFVEILRRVLSEPVQRPFRDRLLDRGEYLGDPHSQLRKEDEMHMLGHRHPRPEVELSLGPTETHRLDEPCPRSVTIEEW
jgi:hypothetical protein